jgi:tetratricopeptide (TPR) repeat protein
VFAVTVLAAGGAWWWSHRTTATPPPPLPGEISEDEVRQAVEEARRQVLADPNSAAAWGRLGMVFLANSIEGESDQCFAEAARLDPTDPRWPYARGRIAIKRDADHALPYLRQAAAAAAAGPWSKYRAAIRLQLAEALLERNEVDEAAGLFQAELNNPEYRLRAANGLGLVALARGDDRAAAEYLAVARASPVVRRQATAQLAALARGRGDQAAAAAYEAEATAIPTGSVPPTWPDPFIGEVADLRVGRLGRKQLAKELEEQGRYAELAELFLRQTRDDPTPEAYAHAGLNFARMEDFDRAIPLLREAVRLGPDSALAQYHLALALFSRAEKENARSPGSAQAREGFGEAADHARRAAELKPGHGLAYLFWGLALKQLGRPGEAVDPLRKGVAARPEEFELQLALGEVLAATGRGAEAKTYLENARRLDPKDPRPGQALERLKTTGR